MCSFPKTNRLKKELYLKKLIDFLTNNPYNVLYHSNTPNQVPLCSFTEIISTFKGTDQISKNSGTIKNKKITPQLLSLSQKAKELESLIPGVAVDRSAHTPSLFLLNSKRVCQIIAYKHQTLNSAPPFSSTSQKKKPWLFPIPQKKELQKVRMFESSIHSDHISKQPPSLEDPKESAFFFNEDTVHSGGMCGKSQNLKTIADAKLDDESQIQKKFNQSPDLLDSQKPHQKLDKKTINNTQDTIIDICTLLAKTAAMGSTYLVGCKTLQEMQKVLVECKHPHYICLGGICKESYIDHRDCQQLAQLDMTYLGHTDFLSMCNSVPGAWLHTMLLPQNTLAYLLKCAF